MDRFRFVRAGISEDLQDARSDWRAVLRKIFLASFDRSVFPAKILSWANPESFKLLKQNPSIPAPLRHERIKILICHFPPPIGRNLVNRRNNLLPLGTNREEILLVGTLACTHAVTWINIRLFSRLTMQSNVWLYDRLIGHTRMQSFVCLLKYSVKQSVDQYFNSLNSHTMICPTGRIIVWPNTSCLFRPFVACGFEVALYGTIDYYAMNWIGRYLCRCNDSDVDGSRLARFYGGRVQ